MDTHDERLLVMLWRIALHLEAGFSLVAGSTLHEDLEALLRELHQPTEKS